MTVNFKLESIDPQDFVRAIEKIDADDIKQALLAAVDSIVHVELVNA